MGLIVTPKYGRGAIPFESDFRKEKEEGMVSHLSEEGEDVVGLRLHEQQHRVVPCCFLGCVLAVGCCRCVCVFLVMGGW